MNEDIVIDATPEPVIATDEIVSVDYADITQRQDFSLVIDLMLLFSVWVCIGVLSVSIFRGH